MLLHGLVVFLWLLCIVVAIVATVLLITGSPDGTWAAAIFWWAVVGVSFYLHRKAVRKQNVN
jgi:membrane protein implicated in regulation of membrane protease activity